MNVHHLAIVESQSTIRIISIAATSFAIEEIVIIKIFLTLLLRIGARALVKSDACTTVDHDGSEGTTPTRRNVALPYANVLAYG